MLKKQFLTCFMVLLGLLHMGAASAISLEAIPSSATISLGDSVDVEILIGGLGDGSAPSLGAYDIDLTYVLVCSV